MPTVTLTALFDNLDSWPGRLFEAENGATILVQTATNFSFSYPAGHPFAGFQVVALGTGFTYDAGVPIAGNMTVVQVRDPALNPVITFNNLQANPFAADLSQFYANVFGSTTPEGDGPGPDGKMAWNHLLSGADIINGTAGNDNRTLVGVDVGNDTYNMGAGDDQVSGGIGSDTINGGDGYDRLTYRETTFNEGGSAFKGATFNIATGRVFDPWGGTDVISGFEEFEGSRFNDFYNGTADRDRFSGLRGRDRIDGGENTFDGLGNVIDDRRDEVRYGDDYWQGGTRGIIANLEVALTAGSIRGTVRDGFGNVDSVYDIERVSGTRYNDIFNGSQVGNHFFGGEGKDRFDGKDGFDTLRMERWFGDTDVGGVNVDLSRLANQVINDGFGNVETALNMEGIISGDGNDTLKGNASDNYFEAQGGRDVMTGGGGVDEFLWWEDAQFGDGDRITDFGTDDIVSFDTVGFTGMTTTLTLVNGTAATAAVGTFIFNAVNDILYWDRDGTGVASAVAVVQLVNVASLSETNIFLY